MGRKVPDIRRLARAIGGAGIDPRHWVSYGTVATVDDNGNVDPTDKRAVFIGPEGVECDVVLEPLNVPVTAIYAGLQGGRACTFFTPIKPGDRVLVTLPDGDPNVPPVISAILHSASDPVPSEGGRPIFQNDRVFLWAEAAPIDVRTRGGARLLMEQSGNITVTPGSGALQLGGDTDLEAAARGDTLQARYDDLVTKFNAHTHTGVTTGVGTSGPTPLQLDPAVLTSSNVKVKK